MRHVTSPTGVQIACQVEGEGTPLVMVHGFGASIYSWRHLVPALEQRQPLILLDLKGFGRPVVAYSLRSVVQSEL